MKVVEVDQWSSTGNVTDFSMADFENGNAFQEVEGGDSRAAKQIFGGFCVIREVEETDHPRLSKVWFKEGADGKLEFYKANFDSSD